MREPSSLAPPHTPQRLPLIDALKAVASQMIVLHHLAFYGPMTDFIHPLIPDVVTWFSQHARMAVQVFLVISGFLTVRTLAPQGVLRAPHPLRLLGKRWINITLPYVVSLLVAIACTALAQQWMSHHSLPAPPEWDQFLAHALLLHSWLGIDSLSAGVWYVAIDMQLFALTLCLLWCGQRWGMAWVMAMGLASLVWFNRDASWDNWAMYFFAAYALGGLAWWLGQASPVISLRSGVVVLVVVVVALAVDFRSRIALAAGVAVLLGWACRQGVLYRWPRSTVLAYLGRISYGVFLMNFPVALVVNAAFTRFAPAEVGIQTVGVVVAWLSCIAAGAVFHHTVEEPLRRLGQRRTPHQVQ